MGKYENSNEKITYDTGKLFFHKYREDLPSDKAKDMANKLCDMNYKTMRKPLHDACLVGVEEEYQKDKQKA